MVALHAHMHLKNAMHSADVICKPCYLSFVWSGTFTFMHLADAFIRSDLQCIQAIHFFVSMLVSS